MQALLAICYVLHACVPFWKIIAIDEVTSTGLDLSLDLLNDNAHILRMFVYMCLNNFKQLIFKFYL